MKYAVNIRRSLEENELLKQDMEPFYEERNQWGIKALTIKKYNARISTGSLEQSIRGIRFKQYRPQLIIIDDIEDFESVQSSDNRNKVFNWFVREIVPAMEKNGRIVVVGTLLHKDSFVSRLKNNILEGKTEGIYREYPIMDKNGLPQWPDKFRDLEEIEKERKRIMDEAAWQTEFLLNPTENIENPISPKWIQYYDVIPSNIEKKYRLAAIGIDLAISKKESANHSAMVAARIYGFEENLKIYILPSPIKEKLSSLETIEKAKWLFKSIRKGETRIFVEDVAYQRSFVENLISQGYPAEGVKVSGQDKYSRLRFVSYLVQSGHVLFPKIGAEELINQLVYFEAEGNNDLADAFSILLMKIIEINNQPKPRLTIF